MHAHIVTETVYICIRLQKHILIFSLDILIKKMLKSEHDQFLMDLKS